MGIVIVLAGMILTDQMKKGGTAVSPFSFRICPNQFCSNFFSHDDS
jgi:hypothetical protein